MDGQWNVLGTTFPMWKKGDKRNPRFRYTLLEPGLWKDEVLYDKPNGKIGIIRGKDRLLGENPKRFKWRGDGWLFIAVSLWQIDYVSPDGQTMLISFEKTLFTPAGADVISRKNILTDFEKQELYQQFQARFAGVLDADWQWLK